MEKIMLTARQLMSSAVACLAFSMLPATSLADPCPFPCAAMSLTSVLTGGDGYSARLVFIGDVATVTGSQIAGDTLHPEGVLIESAIAGRTFEHLKLTTNYLGNFMIDPASGADASNLWLVTQTSGGIMLDWQPGAHKLGEGAQVPGVVGLEYYKLSLKLDPTATTQRDLTAFDAASFTVQATPEPGLLMLGSFMTGFTLPLCKERRRMLRQRRQ